MTRLLSIQHKLLVSHFLAVLLVSGSIGTFFYFGAYDSLKYSLQTRLQNSAALLSQIIDARELRGIDQPAAVSNRTYQSVLARLRQCRMTNPDIAYLYLMRRRGSTVVFVVDSDETAQQALPGSVYSNAPPALLRGFAAAAVDGRIYEDEWGAFMSGYAPLQHGAGAYLVGIDMRAAEVRQKFKQLHMVGLASLCMSLIMAYAFSRVLARHFTRPIGALIGHCRAIADNQLDERIAVRTGDELDNLIDAFNALSANLAAARARRDCAEAELRNANEQLEKTLHGLLPICASCKKIRNDQGYWQQVEQYVHEHSGAEFTHGLCPDCVQRLYPNL